MRGLVWVLLILAVATAFGLWRRRTDGRMRPTGRPASGRPASGLAVADGVAQMAGHPEPARTAPHLTAEDLGAPLGEAATLVEFSSAFCQPCRATKQVLTQVAEMVPGVEFVEIDAESRLDLVRQLGVMRTPTVFVLASDGTVHTRASGTPRKADVIAAIGELVP